MSFRRLVMIAILIAVAIGVLAGVLWIEVWFAYQLIPWWARHPAHS